MLAPVGGILHGCPSAVPLRWPSTPTRASKHRQKQKQNSINNNGSREIRILKQLLRSYPWHLILCFCWLLEIKILYLFWAEAILFPTYVLPAGHTPYWKRHNTRAMCITPLQPILEEGLHSRQSFLVRVTNQFDAFVNPKNASEKKATRNK